MTKDQAPTAEHAKIRLLSGPLTEDEDPEMWAVIFSCRDHLAQWFRAIGVELVVHPDYRIALVRQMTEQQLERRAVETGKAVLPPVLKSRALTFFESQVLTYLHEKLNTAASMGIHDLTLLKTEVHGAIVNLQPEAQRNREARLVDRVDTALRKFEQYGLVEETHLDARPAIRPNLALLVMVSQDEMARFNAMVEGLLGEPEGGVDTGLAGGDRHENGSVYSAPAESDAGGSEARHHEQA